MAAVALRKESVDRNGKFLPQSILPDVALRKESVDRNKKLRTYVLHRLLSLSARRAWIEINNQNAGTSYSIKSLSARRAWIEIAALQDAWSCPLVALRKESVDRNNRDSNGVKNVARSRSPQGERG